MIAKTNTVRLIAAGVLLTFVGFITVCSRGGAQTLNAHAKPGQEHEKWLDEPIQPIMLEINLDGAKVLLGEKLFNDKQLSHNNTVSCATCHALDLGGTDQLPRSIGIDGNEGDINAPTVFNAAFNFTQFWDGRAKTLEAQIDGPTHSPLEMGSNWEEITGKLGRSPDYPAAFASLYPDGIDAKNIRDAIAVYERSLITPNSRFDRFLRGNQDSLTNEEKEGYQIFKSVGCVSCHQGVNAGGNLFQEFGVMGAYFTDRGKITKADLGRYNVTHEEYDKYVFKVPTLRNISKTFPYFHDGSAKTLEDAVKVMSKYQLGRELSSQEVDSIVLFLRTLDGEYKRYGQQ
jgi:cytochrome c peroxidase